MISETNIGDSFPARQFITPYRLDRNESCGWVLVYIWKDIASKLIPTDFSNREGFL